MRILFLVVFAVNYGMAQKVVERSLLGRDTSFIKIDVSQCFQLFIDTSEGDDIVAEAVLDGEYGRELVLDVKSNGATTTVGTDFRPTFRNPNDKLSAHKVVSILLKVTVPKSRSVEVYGTGCNVMVEGTYRHLRVILNDGKCMLNNVSETVEVVTQSGDINVKSKAAEILANSKYGRVDRSEIPRGDNRFTLTTITGDINLRKTE